MMEQVKDKGGHCLTLQKINGRYYPPFPSHVINEMTSLPIRHDDIILAGYLKAGTHWVWEVLRMLLHGSVDIPNVEKDAAMMELTEQAEIEKLPARRVLNTHVHFDQLPADVLTKRPKIIYLTRNPKDIEVSLYNHHKKLESFYHYDGGFEDHFHLFMEGKVDYGSWFSHIQSWSEGQRLCEARHHIDFLDVNYEDMIQNPTEKIGDLVAFLDIEVSHDLISAISDRCHITRMRERKAAFDLDDNGGSIMYRKGTTSCH